MELSNILHLGRNYPLHQYMLGTGQVESRFAEKDLRVLGDKMTVSQQHALVAQAASSTLGCVRQSIASRLWEVSLTFC